MLVFVNEPVRLLTGIHLLIFIETILLPMSCSDNILNKSIH
jgi:hypothetical protein